MGSGGKKSEDVEEQDGLDEGVVGQGKKVVGGGNGGLGDNSDIKFQKLKYGWWLLECAWVFGNFPIAIQ